VTEPIRPGAGFDANELLSGAFASPTMLDVFSATNSVRKWLEFEGSLARAEAAAGVIPAEAAVSISRAASAFQIDIPAMREEVEYAVHPVVPLVRRLSEICEGESGEYVHWGATTQDVMDTGLVLQLREAWTVLDASVRTLIENAAKLAEKHKNTVMPGRTHAQHAVPITFGYKVAVWLDELVRTHASMERDCKEIFSVQFGGAAGTLATLGSAGLEVRAKMAEELDLAVPTITWHTSRDRLLRFGFGCLLFAITAQKIGREIIDLQRTDILELEEPFHLGKVGSSTMPHKRNPSLAETLFTLGAIAQGEFSGLATASVQEHERDMAAWQQEWDRLPRLVVFTHRAVELAGTVLDGLTVNEERMKQNLEMSHGLIHSETIMMSLADEIGRQEAHELVYEVAMRAHENAIPLRDALAQDERLKGIDIDKLFNRVETLQAAPQLVDAVVASARRMERAT
jgi:3-carboxy-cis,cis-muconate cycloisomerase